MDSLADVFMDDVLLPQVFITDYLPKLSYLAIKVYISSLLFKDNQNKVKTESCRRQLSLSEEDTKAALMELVSQELVIADADLESFTLINLKKKAIERSYRKITAKPMKESVENNSKSKERNALISSVNNTYFQGMMGPNWYQAIDNWFDTYGFEPAVVYQMFVDAAERNVLHGPNYLNTVAADYGRKQVKTFRDLAQYKEQNKAVTRLARRVGKALNKRMTSFDFTIVEKWLIEYKYDYDIIELALESAVRLSEPNLNYFDKILSSWHEAGIKTRKEAENLLKNNQQEAEKQRKSRASRKSNLPHIDEREYSDEEIESYYYYAVSKDEDEEE